MDASTIEAQQARAEAEALRRVVEGMSDYAIFLVDTEGRVRTWNAGAERAKGYTRDEIVGRPISVFFPPEDVAAGLPDLQLAEAARHGRSETEGWRLRKDGSRFWANAVLTALRDDQGRLEGFAKVTRDLSARRRQEERFRLVVESSPAAMLMVDPAGRIELVNTQAERLFGYPRLELLGASIDTLVPRRFAGRHHADRGAYAHAPERRAMGAGRDLFARRKDGSEVPVEIGLNPIDTDEGPRVLASVVDISDRKQKENRIAAALAEKELLLQEIHHRVKNNLQVVYYLLDLHADRTSDGGAKAVFADCQHRVLAMSLVHETLYRSRDFGRVDFAVFGAALLPALAQALALDTRRVELRTDLAPVLLPIDTAIPLGLLLSELVTNAIKHAFPDARSGHVNVSLVEVEDRRLRLAVTDDGVGLPATPDPSRSPTLGLSLVSMLAKQLGATLAFGVGPATSVTLEFPAPAS